MTRYLSDNAAPPKDASRRCCSSHESLNELTQHLRCEFPGLDAQTIAREVARAVAAAKLVGIADDELLMVELVARAQLELRAGRRVEIARLDPQNHPGLAGPSALASDTPAVA